MVARHQHLLRGIRRIGRAGEALRHLLERGERLLGGGLVALGIGDLVVVGDGDQIIGIARVLVAGVQRDEAVGGDDRVVPLARR